MDEFSVKLLDLLGTKKVVYDGGLTSEPSEVEPESEDSSSEEK
jgi:hypothetical protein